METQITPWEQAYIQRYVVPGTAKNLLAKLQTHVAGVWKFLQGISKSEEGHAYQTGKWTVRQVAGHLVDAHVIFSHRAYCISRGEKKNLPGFEENDYAPFWEKNQIPVREIARLYALHSECTLAQLAAMGSQDLEQMGSANAIGLTPLVIYRAMIGHESHHMQVLREKYGMEF